MVKYKVSKYVSIYSMDSSYNAIPEKYAAGNFILQDQAGDSEYLINSTIKYYIDKFNVYKTGDEALREVEADLQCKSILLKDTCSRFFDFLCKTNILVPGNKIENDIISDMLYKEGDIIDSLRISKILSGRSYTDLYCATDTIDGGTYAIKLLNRKKTMNRHRYQKELEDMEQEYRMLQKVKHIGSINKAYDFKISGDNHPYLILEYIDGKSLSRYMKEEGSTLTNACCLQIIDGIVAAFSSLHENNILHGDIHSANILITKDKKVTIIDLGMSRDVAIEENKIIKSGGAYYYMPPERINITSFKKFSKDADLFSDVYQVGLLIYFILYKTLPFEGFIWEELAESIKENNINCPPVSFLNHPVHSSLINIMQKCLDKDCRKRYRNASEILSDFKNHTVAGQQFAEI